MASVMDEKAITACLDGNWCTVAQIRSRLGVGIDRAGKLADALKRLADTGNIESLEQETTAPRRRGKTLTGTLVIRFYRRCAAQVHHQSVDAAPAASTDCTTEPDKQGKRR